MAVGLTTDTIPIDCVTKSQVFVKSRTEPALNCRDGISISVCDVIVTLCPAEIRTGLMAVGNVVAGSWITALVEPLMILQVDGVCQSPFCLETWVVVETAIKAESLPAVRSKLAPIVARLRVNVLAG